MRAQKRVEKMIKGKEEQTQRKKIPPKRRKALVLISTPTL